MPLLEEAQHRIEEQRLQHREKDQDEDDLAKARIYWGMGLAYRDSEDLAQAVLYMDLSVKLFKKHAAWFRPGGLAWRRRPFSCPTP